MQQQFGALPPCQGLGILSEESNFLRRKISPKVKENSSHEQGGQLAKCIYYWKGHRKQFSWQFIWQGRHIEWSSSTFSPMHWTRNKCFKGPQPCLIFDQGQNYYVFWRIWKIQRKVENLTDLWKSIFSRSSSVCSYAVLQFPIKLYPTPFALNSPIIKHTENC